MVDGKFGSPVVVKNDLQRNHYIRNVVLFEENSILPLPECLESPGTSLRKEVLGRYWEGPFDKKPFDKNSRPSLKHD